MVITASDSVVVKRINPAVCLTPADILYIQWVRVWGIGEGDAFGVDMMYIYQMNPPQKSFSSYF